MFVSSEVDQSEETERPIKNAPLWTRNTDRLLAKYGCK
jgi:hypothetical protein